MAAGGGGSSSAPSGGASGSGSSGTLHVPVLEYDDVTWEVNKRGQRVILGRGAFGIVYTGVLHGQPVAIKAEVLKEGEEQHQGARRVEQVKVTSNVSRRAT